MSKLNETDTFLITSNSPVTLDSSQSEGRKSVHDDSSWTAESTNISKADATVVTKVITTAVTFMDGSEATMDRIKYEQEKGARRGDQVKMWMKAMATIGWLVKQARRRGVMVWVAWRAYMPRSEAAMDRIKYKQRMGVGRGDQVRMWMKAMAMIG